MNIVTKPSIRKEKRGNPLRVVLVGLILTATTVACALLTLPTLLLPPPTSEPPYSLALPWEASATLVPGADSMLVSQNGDVVLYLPVGAYQGGGLLVLQSRPPELTPFRIQDGYRREMAVDVLILSEEGQVLSGVALSQTALLCFSIGETWVGAMASDQAAVRIQYFDDRPEALNWQDLQIGPGWETGQLCASLDHLSLFAVALLEGSLESAPHLDEPPAVDSPDPPLYGVPPA